MKSKDVRHERRKYRDMYILYLGDENVFKGIYQIHSARTEDNTLKFTINDGRNSTQVSIDDADLDMLETKLIPEDKLWKYAEYLI